MIFKNILNNFKVDDLLIWLFPASPHTHLAFKHTQKKKKLKGATKAYIYCNK